MRKLKKKREPRDVAPPEKWSPPRRLTQAEWLAEGKARFGENTRKWRFVCPICKHVQSMESVLAMREDMTPSEAEGYVYFSCEGRFAPGSGKAFGKTVPDPKIGCDYTLGGLFKIARVEVVTPEARILPVFEFDGAEEK